ncbi:MAG TPA: hypothetical protein VLH56_19215 [Dissulfurispiraceae bacterium]|nr:hypothetical protein [Dissulfurispiraceae bacterium]
MEEDHIYPPPDLVLADAGRVETMIRDGRETRPKYKRRKKGCGDDLTAIPQPSYEPVNLTPHESQKPIPAKLVGTVPRGYTLIDVYKAINLVGLDKWRAMGYHKRDNLLAEVRSNGSS